jgi:hypothetical protein
MSEVFESRWVRASDADIVACLRAPKASTYVPTFFSVVMVDSTTFVVIRLRFSVFVVISML